MDLTGTVVCDTCGYLLSKRLHDCCIEQLEAMKPEKAPEEPALIEEPTLIRFIHAYRLSVFMGLEVQDIVDTIVYDLKQN